MDKIHLYDKIFSPMVTEKSTNLSEQNKIVFKVPAGANKTNLKKNIEKIYITASGGPFRKLSLKKFKNISVKDKSIIKNSEINKSIKKAEKLMNGHGRILVRESGTESKIRVMGESENKELLDKCINIILRKIK